MRLVASVHHRCQRDITVHEPYPPTIVEIDEVIVDQMQWLGFAHLIGLPSVDVLMILGQRHRGQTIGNIVNTDGVESSPNEDEHPSQGHVTMVVPWQPGESKTENRVLDKAS